MSVSGISSSSFFDPTSKPVQNKAPQIQQDFLQLGKDLQSGNLSSAQQDYATIQKDFNTNAPQPHRHPHSHGDTTINQLLAELGQSLQTGNLPTAQQAYSALQQESQIPNASDGFFSAPPTYGPKPNSVSMNA